MRTRARTSICKFRLTVCTSVCTVELQRARGLTRNGGRRVWSSGEGGHENVWASPKYHHRHILAGDSGDCSSCYWGGALNTRTCIYTYTHFVWAPIYRGLARLECGLLV